jgi:hypothetical protein
MRPHPARAFRLLVLLASVACACAVPGARAHAQGLVVHGRVLDASGAPIPSAEVTATLLPDSTARRTVTDAAGRYEIALPRRAEQVELNAERIGFYGLTVEVTPEPGAGRVEREIRLSPQTVVLDLVEVRAARPPNRPPAARTPGGRDEATLAVFDLETPVPPGDLSAVAALQRGVVQTGAGLSIGAQPPSQTGITLDGASFGATSLPSEALRSTAVAASTFDPSRGQFSGGQVAATTLSGTNVFGGAARLRLAHPALQAGASTGPSGRNEVRVGEFSGGAGGALVRDRLYWYGAAQGTLRSQAGVTLADAGAATLRSLGVHPDSARRLFEIVQRLGYPAAAGPAATDREAAAASGLLRLDYALHPDHLLMLRLDGRGTRVRGTGASPLALAGGGEAREGAGGVMAQLTSYRGEARNELRAYGARGTRRAEGGTEGPAATVQVGSLLDDGERGSAVLRFGGSPLAGTEAETRFWELSDELVLPLRAGSRVKVGGLANGEAVDLSGAANRFGTFTFASLGDLEAGRPSGFSRTLGARASRGESEYAAAFAAHLWRPHRDLSLVYGLRWEGRRYGGAEGAPADSLLGLVPGAVPSEHGVSPRAGFTYEAPSRRWALRGGAGEFRGRIPLAALAPALGETGAADEPHLVCLGPAAPVPDWARYAGDPASVPDACAGGVPVFAARTPRATVFAPGFAAPRTRQATAAWDWSHSVRRVGMLGLTLEGTWIAGTQPIAWDRNFAAAAGFVLPDEGGRTVFAAPDALDPATGAVAPGASRARAGYGIVREAGPGGRSSVLQLSFAASLLSPRLDLLSFYYTWTRARDRVGSLDAPGGGSEPLAGARPREALAAAADLERRHLLQARWSRPLNPWPAEVSLAGRLMSGAPYTPRVDGDVNGDGAANDAAFVFDPAGAADPDVRAGMQSLLDGAPASTAACLRGQLGRVAARNACRGPWSGEVDLQLNAWPGQDLRARRFVVSVTASNVLTGVDRLLNGERGLRGWGQDAAPDPVLLHVRGFDPARRAFRYEVNPGFGARAPWRNPLRQPFTLTVQGRWTFGVDPVRQPLISVFSSVRAQGRSATELRAALAQSIPNLPAQVLALDDTLRLELTAAQQARLRAASDTLARRLMPLVDSLAASLSTVETEPDHRRVDAARERVGVLATEAQRVLDDAVASLREILTREQWNRLPLEVQQPSRQILPARAGFTIQTGEVW